MPGYPSLQRLSSTPDIGAAAEEKDSAEAALRTAKEKDAPYPSSAILEDIMATPNVPSQSPSPQPIVNVGLSGVSNSSLDTGHTGEHSPQHREASMISCNKPDYVFLSSRRYHHYSGLVSDISNASHLGLQVWRMMSN